MTFIFRNRTIFWDISKWNRWQKKWDGGSIWFNGKWSISYQFFVTYIQKLLKKYYNNGPLNAWHYDPFFLFSTYKVWLRQLLISSYIILYYIIYIKKAIDFIYIYIYILISITLWLFNWYQTFYFLAKDKQHV